VTDVAGAAGILYPANAPNNPLNWGTPNLLFSTFSDARLPAASMRSDTRLTMTYSQGRGIGRHQVRLGGDVRIDRTTNESNADARGSYTFTGAYTAPGLTVAGTSGADFADFLLGLPQQATLQHGGTTHLHGNSFDAYVEDVWRPSARLTFNLGLRYELVMPYTEGDGQLANLDVAPDFTAATRVVAGGTGPFTGRFPDALIDPDTNNLGPRLGVAYRIATGTVLRGAYSITYNNGSYAAIARELGAQPPFATTDTILGSPASPAQNYMQTVFQTTSQAAVTNNWGVDRNYQLGNIQTWNGTVTRDFKKNWTAMVSYTGTKGTNLDILRAPNRGPEGLRIPDVQPFIWESSGGHSLLNSGTFQLRRRLASGVMASATYILSKSMDNASSLGAGSPVVAQNDQDLGAEWALSNFDRRHQVSAQAMWEIPFGANRRWLSNGGVLAALVGNWTGTATFSYQTGTPFTARVIGETADVSRGTNGSLRADVTGWPVALSDPTITEFFNTAAFALPAQGTFGDAGRNTIIGPSSHQVNAAITRDVMLGGRRSVTVGVNALNLFNTVQFAAIDTNFNSRTFGEVLSVRPMRTITVTLRMRF
jgi:hypothetical protein